MTYAWDVQIGDYNPATGVVLLHRIGSGLPCQVGGAVPGSPPNPVSWQRQKVRSSDTPRPYRHGSVSRRPDLRSTTYWTVPVTILAADAPSAAAARDALLKAWTERTYPAWMYVTDPAGVRFAVRGKPRDVSSPNETFIRQGIITLNLMFEATAPYRFDQTVKHQFATGGTLGTGMGFPMGFPFGFGTSAGAGQVVCTNAGNAETYPLVVLKNTDVVPVGPWFVRDNARGLAFVYDGHIPVGQIVLVDMGEGVVLQQPSSFAAFDAPLEPPPTDGILVSANVRRPTSDWIDLPSGTTTLDSSIHGGTGEVHVYWRDAWPQ